MLENIRIASPCSADWEKMQGDDLVRHCEACKLNVYNLTAFTESEIRELVANHTGRLCGRIYQRRDGTVMTQNCPVGMRAVARRISRIAGALFTVMVPIFGIAPRIFAQSYTRMNISSAAIDLEVSDPTGATVADAEVTLSQESGKRTLKGKTDKKGRFVLQVVKGGQYVMTISAPGFQSVPQTVDLRPGEKLSLPVTLNVGAFMGEIVTIEGPIISVDSVPTNTPLPLTGAGPKPMQR